MYRPTTLRRLAPLAALALVTAAVWSNAAPAAAQSLTPEEIQRLHAMFDDNPLLGGQVPPRRHLWVNRDVSIFVQFDSNDPALATEMRYIGISVKGVFCAEAQPDGPTGAFPHFHRLTAPVYSQGHGGAPGELGYWLTWLAVDDFVLGTRPVTPGIDYAFFPTPAPTCGDDVPRPKFTAPGEGSLTRDEIADLAAAFDDVVFTGGQHTGLMTTGRADPTATLLTDGRVLLAASNPGQLNSAELYDPATNTWSATANLTTGRTRHVAALLDDGRVLVAGDWYRGEVWSPVTGAWTPTGNMVNWYLKASTATTLADGRVLVVGGETHECDEQFESCWWQPVHTAELYTP